MAKWLAAPHWEEDDEGDIFLDSNREDARLDSLPMMLVLLSVGIMNSLVVVTVFVFKSRPMVDAAIAGMLAAILHALYTLACRIVLGAKFFWQLTCVIPEVVLSGLKLLGSILVLWLVLHEARYETLVTPLFWSCFALSLVVPRSVIFTWLACQQCARRRVSKNRKRYTEGDFDLDLSYITERILAMSFPAEDFEARFRNPLAEVQRFLHGRHPKSHRVYNLCKEKKRRYEQEVFHEVRHRITFYDHCVCPLKQLVELVEEQHQYLAEDPKHVVAIHCKAGKGRTGLVTSCLLLREGAAGDAGEALWTYAQRRTHDQKGITIPSQIRYVKLYESVLQHGLAPAKSVCLHAVRLRGFLKLPGFRSSCFRVQVADSDQVVLVDSGWPSLHQVESETDESTEEPCAAWTLRQEKSSLVLESPAGAAVVSEDFQVILSRRSVWCGLAQVTVLCSFWLNSGYVSKKMHLKLEELDYCRGLQHLSEPLSDDLSVFCSFEF